MSSFNPFSIEGAESNMAGMPGGLSNLFQNKLFLQYLSGAGGALSSGQPVGKALGDITTTNIANQNYMKLLKRMLAGQIPEGGKVTHDEKTTKIDIPKSALGTLEPPTGESDAVMGMGRTPRSATIDTGGYAEPMGGSQIPNPFVSDQLDVSASDLAGLTPENITQAMQFKEAQAVLGQKKIMDFIQGAYLGQLTEESKSRIVQDREQAEIAKQKEARLLIESAMKDDRPALIQEYEYAVGQGYKGTLEEFKSPETTTEWRNYLKVKATEPKYKKSFREYQIEQKRAGATQVNLGTKELERADVAGEKYFKEDWTPDLNKEAAKIKEDIDPTKIKPNTREEFKYLAGKKRDWIEGKVKSFGGKINSRRVEGSTIVWNVTWDNGRTSEVRYAF